jgi:hypothetical protein
MLLLIAHTYDQRENRLAGLIKKERQLESSPLTGMSLQSTTKSKSFRLKYSGLEMFKTSMMDDQSMVINQ